MHKGQPALHHQLARIGAGLVKSFAVQNDIAAHAFGLHHFDGRGGLGHHDRHRHTQTGAVIGQALRMVARRCSDHAALFLFIGQLQQSVERAALFVGGGELQVFKFEPDIRASNLGQRDRMHHRRLHDRAVDTGCGRANVVESQIGWCSDGFGLCYHSTSRASRPSRQGQFDFVGKRDNCL